MQDAGCGMRDAGAKLVERDNHDTVSLAVGAEDEVVGTDIYEPALCVEGLRSWVVLPHPQPECRRAELRRDRFDFMHQTLGEAAAFPDFVDIKPIELNR